MAFGFFLASTTTAGADDLGRVGASGVTGQAVEVIKTAASPAAASAAAAPAPVAPVVEVLEDSVETVVVVVEQPAKVVEQVVADPVEVVRSTTASVVPKVATVVEASATTAADTVGSLVPVVTEGAVEPVVEAVLPPGGDSAPVIDLAPGDEADAPAADAPVSLPAQASQPDAVVDETLTRHVTLAQIVAAEPTTHVFLLDRSPEPAAATSVALPVSSHRPAELPARTPVSPGAALTPGAGSGGAPTSGTPWVAVTPATTMLPETSSAALRSSAWQPHPGPVLDRGSRPD